MAQLQINEAEYSQALNSGHLIKYSLAAMFRCSECSTTVMIVKTGLAKSFLNCCGKIMNEYLQPSIRNRSNKVPRKEM